jgi:tetratricopeptide (TPR) repeat protein
MNPHDISGQFEEHEYELLAPIITAIARSPEADQLCTALALVDGFQLDVVTCPAARDADALLVWLATELPKRRGHAVRFTRVRPDRGPDDARLEPTVLTASILSQLEARRSDPAEATVVVVDATGYRSDEHLAWRWLFQRWNERRNYLAAVVAAPLVLLLPPDLEAVLPGDAPDLWSIRSVSVRLAGGDVAVPRGTISHSNRFEPGALERARAVVAELRAAGDARPSALVPALRRLAEQELDNGHVSEAADVVHRQLAPLRPAIDDPLELAKVDRVEANVLLTLGRSAEALAILRERVLPAIERQGTAYQRALTYRSIAHALKGTGDLDSALRQLQEHALGLDEQMRDDHGRAETQSQIADVLAVRGDLDDALRIRQEILPVYERLGDVRGKAMAQAKIADILFARGQLDEALRIWREEALPVFERLGDVRSKAVTLGNIGSVLFARGNWTRRCGS